MGKFYSTLSGARDLIKIEINYSNRIHLLKTQRTGSTPKLGSVAFVNRLANEELIGSKINALIARTTPRDVYDVYALLENGFIQKGPFLRKIAIFYLCLGTPIPIDFDALLHNTIRKVENLTYPKIRGTLIPVLRKGKSFDLNEMKSCVLKWIAPFFQLDQNDRLFLDSFNNKSFVPNILFKGFEIEDVQNHPMAMWKMK